MHWKLLLYYSLRHFFSRVLTRLHSYILGSSLHKTCVHLHHACVSVVCVYNVYLATACRGMPEFMDPFLCRNDGLEVDSACLLFNQSASQSVSPCVCPVLQLSVNKSFCHQRHTGFLHISCSSVFFMGLKTHLKVPLRHLLTMS